MKRHVACNILAAGLAIAITVPAFASDESKVVALVAAGDLDAALVKRIAGHIQEHLVTAPRILPRTTAVGADSLAGEAKALEPLKADDVAVLIGLVDAAATVKSHGETDPKKGIGIINVTALSQGDPDDEKLGRRLDKESLRAVALLTGMSPCPLPLCALWHYKTLDQLDSKGRNLCLPCRGEFLKRHKEMGLVAAEAPAAPAP